LQTKPQSEAIPWAKSNFWQLKCQEQIQAGSALVRSATSLTPSRPLFVPHQRHVMLGERDRLAGLQDSWQEQRCTSLLWFEGGATCEAVSLPT